MLDISILDETDDEMEEGENSFEHYMSSEDGSPANSKKKSLRFNLQKVECQESKEKENWVQGITPP